MLIYKIFGATADDGGPSCRFSEQNPNQYRNDDSNNANGFQCRIPRGVGFAERCSNLPTYGFANIDSNVKTASNQLVMVYQMPAGFLPISQSAGGRQSHLSPRKIHCGPTRSLIRLTLIASTGA